MPIDKKEFENGKLHSKVEEEILSFLEIRKKRAFTSQEIMGGIHYHTEFSTPEITKMSTFAISDFTALLYDLVRRKRVRMKVVRGRMFFAAESDTIGKCPKCGTEVSRPQKTWKMSGRPSRQGFKTQLVIGLFRCPVHGAFRVALKKEKVRVSATIRKKTKKRIPVKAKVTKRKRTKRSKRKQKKTKGFQLF